MFKPHQKLSSYFDRLKSSDENATLIKTNWDLFYLSFLVGLALDRRSSPENDGGWGEIGDLVHGYVKEEMIAVLVVRHLKNKKIEIQDQTNLKEKLGKIYDLNKGDLSEAGYRLFNEYAFSGFDHIQNSIAPNPSSRFMVLKRIKEFLEKKLN
tara:strand:- start:479 stop:937 length:459 start_codon:yes stop_codon:yes gene_type:complete